jgi:hypothetical protein
MARKAQLSVYLGPELEAAVRRIAARDDRSIAYTLEKLVQAGVQTVNDESLAARAGGEA